MTPIDTVREALERVKSAHDSIPDLGIGAHDQESDVRYGKLCSLADTGRDLLEAMEEHGSEESWDADEEGNPIEPWIWTDPLCHTLAQSYARRVGEVV